MFRTIYVTQGEKITIKDNWLVIAAYEAEKKVPLEDIQTIVLDNPHTMISLYSLNALASVGANIVICDSKHMPTQYIATLQETMMTLKNIYEELKMYCHLSVQ